MTGFVARWSRRKSAAMRLEPSPPPVDAPIVPSLEALDAASDFTAFLQAGVAAAVQASALRVAWETDPRIADFRGMAEYDWDFNAAGYGRLAPGDNVAALVQRLIAPPEASTTIKPEPAIAADVRPPTARGPIADHPDADAEIVARASDPEPIGSPDILLADTAAPRRHGGALPS